MSKVVLTDARAEVRAVTPPGSRSVGGLGSIASTAGLTPLGIIVTRSEVAIAGLFLLAAYGKLWPLNQTNAPQVFSASVEAFKLGLPEFLVRLATSITPWVEAIAAVLMLLGIWSRAAAAVLSVLLAVFIVLIAQALARDLNVSCGCFGKLSPFCTGPLGACNIVQNSVMLAAGLVIALTPRHKLVRPA